MGGLAQLPVKPGKHKAAKRKDWQRIQIHATVPNTVLLEINRLYAKDAKGFESKADFVGGIVQGALDRIDVPEQYRERLEAIERNSLKPRAFLIEKMFRLALPILERSDLRNAKD